MKSSHARICAWGLMAALFPSSALAFDRVQPPEISVGQRAGLAGSFANTAYGPSDVSRGGFSLPGPFSAPKDRGPLLAEVFPSYSPDNGLSAWGMGFAANLQLTRWRVTGNLQYDFTKGDDLTGPFGHMTRGADGNFYPVGLDKPVRVVAGASDTFVAYHPDGSVWTFGGTGARVTNAKGTYAWHLTQVKDSVGHVTNLTWTANATGNLFLSQVDYGGRATPQYRIQLAYQPVTLTDDTGKVRPKFVDYRSGAPLALDQRVTTVTVLARNAQSGAYQERWHYTLGYVQEAIGAAFYLVRVDQTFASGEAAPPVRYAYTLKGSQFSSTQMVEVPELTKLFSTLGVTTDVVQPSRSAVIDVDHDGNSDLELANNARTLISQKGSGTAGDPLRFEVTTPAPSSLPACTATNQTGCVFRGCLPISSEPDFAPLRLLSQLNPTDTDVQVTHFQYDAEARQTGISVCSRDGVRSSYQRVPSEWDPESSVHFVDLNSDHLPDLVRVSFGRYDILPNTTRVNGTQTQAAWGNAVSGNLADPRGNAIEPDDVWVSDACGDGIPDLVGQYGDALMVWHGLGNYQFVQNAQEFHLYDRNGNLFTNFADYDFIPADLNKDGLQDYFVTNAGNSTVSRFIKYFTNIGDRYIETPVAALDTLPDAASAPVIATLDGSGNLAVTVTNSGAAYSVQLEGPGTGLMQSADDGKGTVINFNYTRGPASPGVRHRYALLDAMQVTSSGYDTITYDYDYLNPTVHSVGRFLVGFNQVTRVEGDLPSAPLGTSVMSFLNGDNWGPLLLSSRKTDVRLPDVASIESRTYQDATFQGIPYKRLASSTSGWASADGSKQAVDATTVDAYSGDFCPSQTTKTTHHGTLVTQTTRATPANLANHLHCLEADVVETGTHADASLNFRREQRITRASNGVITDIATSSANGSLLDQHVDYDADSDPIAIRVPGKGTTAISYDPATKLPAKVTGPDGVIVQAAQRNPLTDAMLDVLADRGSAKQHSFASYDGQERVAATWTSLDGSSANAPRKHYTYVYASTNHPASVVTHTLVDAQTGVYRDTTELFTASEEKIGSAQLHDSGWVFDGFMARSRAQARSQRFEVKTQPASVQPQTLDYAALLQGDSGGAPASLETTTRTTLGTDVATSSRLHADVTKATTTGLAVTAAGELSRTTLVNGANAVTTLLDPTGKLQTGYIDEAQTKYGYTYDALNRLRAVALPDGAHQVVAYDDYGRVSSIVRDGVARIANTYAQVAGENTELLATQTFASAPVAPAASVPMRKIAWSYDSAGRKLVETHTDLQSQATKAFSFFYDGATATSPVSDATRISGMLTGVRGDGYTKTFAYRADGKTTHQELALAGFRTIATDYAYREDDGVRDENVTVKDSSGTVLQTSSHHQDVDSYGRPSVTKINGAALATTTYDAFGRPGSVTLTTGDSVSFAYDALTREGIGFDQTRAGQAWSGIASTRFHKNDRGFIGQETLGVGPSSVSRSYSYSPQGFLTQAEEGPKQ